MLQLLNNRTFQTVFLIYSSVLIFLGRQLGHGLTNFDDAYYAQKAKELFNSGNLWIITLNGQPFYDNPPLPFWMTALAYRLFGISSYSAVFFSGIFGVGLVYLTYRLTLYLYKDHWTAFLAAFILIFPGIFADAARRGMLDVTLAFFVTAALFALVKGLEDRRYFFVFGLMTGLAVLTKSVLGLFPYLIGLVFILWHSGWKKVFDPYLVMGVVLGTVIGGSWFFINTLEFGPYFLERHFGASHMSMIPSGTEGWRDWLYITGYLKDMLRNYWPWLPILVVGWYRFGRQGLRQKDTHAMLVFLWATIPFLVLSTSRNQTLRYLFMIFPAFAIMTSKTLADWIGEPIRTRSLPYMTGIVMAMVVVVNATPFEVKVSLTQNSPHVRQIAAIVRLNSPPGQDIGNYRFSFWNPRQSVLFYADRHLARPIREPEELMARMESHPELTWLSPIDEFKKLQARFPGKLYLIQGNRRLAYFTTQENRENIRYDFSNMDLPVVR